jgi:hypothetical protein
MTMTSNEARASVLYDYFGVPTMTILAAYLHARERGLDKGTAWWAVEQWLGNGGGK